ncbi:MAG: hypothetical protein ACAH80_14245 [Alphaproteobacteria bacterium]
MRAFVFLLAALLAATPAMAQIQSGGMRQMNSGSQIEAGNANNHALQGVQQQRTGLGLQQGGLQPGPATAPAVQGGLKPGMKDIQGKLAPRSRAAELAQIEQQLRDIEAKLNAMGALPMKDKGKVGAIQDRCGKLIATLSNIMKKMSETQAAIIGNMK